MQERQTIEIGGHSGQQFEVRRDGHSISSFTSYSSVGGLSGFKVGFTDGFATDVGDITAGGTKRQDDLDSNLLGKIHFYTNSDGKKVVGLRLTQQSGSVLHGKETEHVQTVGLPARNRFLGISGKYEMSCIVSIKFTYESERPAMQCPNPTPPSNGEHNSRGYTTHDDVPRNSGQKQATSNGQELLANLGWIAFGFAIVGGACKVAFDTWNRASEKKSRSESQSGSDAGSDRCDNPY